MPEVADDAIQGHPVVSREQWLSARTAFLAREKEFTRLRDDLSRQRRKLPWVKVEKSYVFDGPAGKLLSLRPWHRHAEHRLPLPRPGSEGAR